MSILTIVTDGACANNQSDANLGGWGAVLLYKDHVKTLFGAEANTTNNRMEMTALLEAFKSLKRRDMPIEVYSDSAYLVNAFQQRWFEKWQRNQWKNSKKEPVENQDLWMALLEQTAMIPQLRFYKIKGHLRPDDETALKHWYKKFCEDNHCDHDYHRFLELCALNRQADALANQGVDSLRAEA